MSLALALPISSRSITCPQQAQIPQEHLGPLMALPSLSWDTAAHGTGASCSSTLQPPFRRGLASSPFSSLESICSSLLGLVEPESCSHLSVCRCGWMLVPALQDWPPWVRMAPDSQLDQLLPNSELLFSG